MLRGDAGTTDVTSMCLVGYEWGAPGCLAHFCISESGAGPNIPRSQRNENGATRKRGMS